MSFQTFLFSVSICNLQAFDLILLTWFAVLSNGSFYIAIAVFTLGPHFNGTVYSVVLIAWALLDLLTIGYHLWNGLRTAVFLVHLIFVGRFLVSRHIEELNRELKLQIVSLNKFTTMKNHNEQSQNYCSIQPNLKTKIKTKTKEQQQKQSYLTLHLNRFYLEYRYLLGLIATFNRQLASGLLFTAILTNVPLNLVLTGNIFFRESVQPAAVIMIVLVLIFQTGLPLLSAAGLTALSNCFYRSDRLLYQAQMMMKLSENRSQQFNFKQHKENYNKNKQQQTRQHKTAVLKTKLKLSVFYETLCTKKKFRFTFGPHTKVSWSTIFEFLFVYSGFILTVAKMIKNGRL